MEDRDPLLEHFQNFDVNAVDGLGYDQEGQQQEQLNSSGTPNQEASVLRRSVTEQDLQKMKNNEMQLKDQQLMELQHQNEELGKIIEQMTQDMQMIRQ